MNEPSKLPKFKVCKCGNRILDWKKECAACYMKRMERLEDPIREVKRKCKCKGKCRG